MPHTPIPLSLLAIMPKVSKIKSRRVVGVKSESSETDMLDAVADASDVEQFHDAEDGADGVAPTLPPMGDTGKDDGLEGDADEGDETKQEDILETKQKEDILDTKQEDIPDASMAVAVDPIAAAAASTGGLLSANPPASLANDFRGGQESWNAMLYQLLLYKAQRGDLNIPHNDTSYRLLYNWVQTQRKHHKLYQENKTSSTFLNADRIAVLDAIDFHWIIRGDTFWQKNFDSLMVYKNEHGDVRVPRLYNKNPKLGEWVTDQRRQWKAKMDGKPNMMTDERKAKLDELGFVWKVRDRADWNDRYEQLLEFKKEVRELHFSCSICLSLCMCQVLTLNPYTHL